MDNPLLMVDSLAGEGPKIRLDATSCGTPARFQFQIHNDLQLFDNLEFTGNGTQDFVITGDFAITTSRAASRKPAPAC